jgi:hypothetical protein
MNTRPILALIRTWLAAQHPVSPQADHDGTGKVFDPSQEAMVAECTIRHDHIQASIRAVLAQRLDLLDADFDRGLLAHDASRVEWQRPTLPALGYPGQHRIGIALDDRVAPHRLGWRALVA